VLAQVEDEGHQETVTNEDLQELIKSSIEDEEQKRQQLKILHEFA
jgi:hypothetical protein